LLDGNTPSATSLDEGSDSTSENPVSKDDGEETKPEGEAKPADSTTKTSDPASSKDSSPEDPAKDVATDKEDTVAVGNGKDKKVKVAEPKPPPKDLPIYPLEKKVAADSLTLRDFFYLACGEDPALYSADAKDHFTSKKENGTKPKKKGKKGKDNSRKNEDEKEEPPIEQVMRETIPWLNELEEKTRVKCTFRFSGFHPPPPFR
jgi:hypothetical protein